MKVCITFLIFIVLICFVSAGNVLVWQGQSYSGANFPQGTYEFNFSDY